MTTTRKTITVTDQQDEWIKSRIAAGEFTNDSEYIRDLIRRDQERRQLAIHELRKMVDAAEASGISTLSMSDIKAEAKREMGLWQLG